MVLKVFLSSNQNEFKKERKAIFKGISEDDSLNSYVDIFAFEEDIARPKPADEVFINAVKESDVYIGLIGSDYGPIYDDGFSATEFEYNLYISDKSDAYFFVKRAKNRDDGSIKFLNRIRDAKKYKSFETIDELVSEVKRSLFDYINSKLHNENFDSVVIEDSSFDDVDESALKLFVDSLEDIKLKNLIGKRSFDKILEYIGAGVIDDKGDFHLTNAGALCFAKDIRKFNLEHDIKMVRFNGNGRLYVIDKLFSKKSFFLLLEEFRDFFYKNTKMGFVVKGLRRTNIPEYPFMAIREGFINAIVHRDYNLKGNSITFYIYDNRIEIMSPGKLPYPLTVKDLGLDFNPKHRNENICRIFEHTEYMEHVGTGIARMRSEMKNSCLPEPEFYNESFFKVIFRGPDGKLLYNEADVDENIEDLTKYDLNNRQLEAYASMVNDKETFTYESYSKKFNISPSTAKRDLFDLISKDLVVKNKNGRVNIFKDSLS